MIYYKVPKHLDQHGTTETHFLVEDELYTPKECERYNVPVDLLQPVNISRKSTYWFFGARFEIGEE